MSFEKFEKDSCRFSFAIIGTYPDDGSDYICRYEVDEENGRKAHDLLCGKLGHEGQMGELLEEYFGKKPEGEELLEFCAANGIRFGFGSSEWR